jgi:penicillin-binding protein 1C
MRRLFRQAGLPRRQLASACDTDQAGEGQAPQIQEPMRGVNYVLRSGHSRALALRADGGPDARTLHWFADDAMIGQVKPGTALSWTPPQAGRYVLRVVDDQGRADARELQVEEAP